MRSKSPNSRLIKSGSDGASNAFFYGAAASLNWNQKIGLSLDTKVSKEFDSMNSISVVGYY
jgi:hypothetical protein